MRRWAWVGWSVDEPHVSSRRARLGAELRRLRMRRGLSGTQLAEMLEWSQSKVSRLETAERAAAVADVIAWLEAVEADGSVRDELLMLAESVQRQATGLRALHRGMLARRQAELGEMDAQATLVRQFQPLLVPGVFHTEDYARACISAANLTGERDVEAAVAKRLERGRRLVSSPGPAYHAVVCEQALRWRPGGGHDDLAEVWRCVVNATRRPNITVQVIPLGARMNALPQCAFTLWYWTDSDEPPLALVETPAAEVTFTGSADMAVFELVWQRMLDSALSPKDSARWLARNAPG
jgi:transcriptional regulator with XRE-family HTH domain